MKINELYIEQTNQFCEANCKITAGEILAKAKQRQSENVVAGIQSTKEITNNPATEETHSTSEEMQATASSEQKEMTKEATSKKTGKVITMSSGKKTMFRLSHVVAACLAIFLLTGTTILAFSGKIGQIFGDAGATVIAFDESKMEIFFRDILDDETTAELVGKGYLYEINQVQEDENFRIEVIAASGDIYNAKLAIDVYVKDEKLAAANDRIYLVCYMTNPGEELVKDPNGCRVTGAYGIKDEETDNLYHILMDIGSTHAETVYHFTSVITTFASDENQELYVYDWLTYFERDPFWRWHTMDLRFNITIPEGAYSQTVNRRYREVVYQGTKYEYHLDMVEYGYYDTKLNFYFDYESDFVPSNENAQYDHERFMATELHSMLQDSALIVDGKEYYYEDNFLPISFCTLSEEEGVADRCQISIYFPAVDYLESDSILLRIGDETYDLKESE